MGDPKKRRKKYEPPRHPWEVDVLAEELRLLGLYGLRNKRELWRAKTMLSKIRHIARSLLGMPQEKRIKIESELMNKLYKLGLVDKNATVEYVLDLKVEDILERRLQTIVARLGLAKTVYQARHFITHGHIFVGDKKVTSPGYLVLKEEESKITYSPDSPLADENHPMRKAIVQQVS